MLCNSHTSLNAFFAQSTLSTNNPGSFAVSPVKGIFFSKSDVIKLVFDVYMEPFADPVGLRMSVFSLAMVNVFDIATLEFCKFYPAA